MGLNPEQKVYPYLAYEDAPAAIDFLCKAFGFEERFRMPMPDGRLGHAELSLAGTVIMLASVYREMGHASPRSLGATHSQVLFYVDDVDAHFERAREAGAIIAAEPEDQPHGARQYRAVDPEGHRWIFSTQLREVPLEDLKPPE